ncbi:MAG: peptidase [Bdellovibrionales bacterium]|nr:peptidase [Bdellovibrionales bacterium]
MSVRESLSKQKISKKPIVIDPSLGLAFSTEDELYQHFSKDISQLEKEYISLRSQNDIPEEEQDKYELQLEQTLENPDEIWVDETTLNGQKISIYIKEFFESESESIFHIAVTYTADDVPSFVYLHFPTKYIELVEKYQRGQIVYDRLLEEAPLGAIEGDALLEGDELAIGLYESMLKVRSEEDIPESSFRDYVHLREPTIEEADEIWRNNDSFGNVLVNFVKEFPDEEGGGVFYIVVTIEDVISNSHALLFSFPSKDKNLVTRYKQGESLHAEDVSQESSH